MPINAIQTAADLRLEAGRLKEQAERLLRAADVLDPESVKAPPLKDFPLPAKESSDAVDFSSLNQAEAAYKVLKARGGAMDRDDLFKEVKLRGGRGSSIESFSSVLSRAKEKFVSLGKGKWDLVERLSAGQRVFVEE